MLIQFSLKSWVVSPDLNLEKSNVSTILNKKRTNYRTIIFYTKAKKMAKGPMSKYDLKKLKKTDTVEIIKAYYY